jgi:hypothetical protein
MCAVVDLAVVLMLVWEMDWEKLLLERRYLMRPSCTVCLCHVTHHAGSVCSTSGSGQAAVDTVGLGNGCT